jgi:TonB-dependent starch-binding outer membrane protein SusC
MSTFTRVVWFASFIALAAPMEALGTSGAAQENVPVFASTPVGQGGNAADSNSSSLLYSRANLEVKGVPLAEGLSKLRRTAGVLVAFSPSLIPAELRVSCDCREVTVKEAVETLLRNTRLEYTVLGDQLVIRQGLQPAEPPPPAAIALPAPEFRTVSRVVHGMGAPAAPVRRTGTVAGTVQAVGSGRPLPSVQVFVEGAGIGGLTDAGGRYALSGVPAGQATVSFRLIGYAPQDVVVTVRSGETTIQDVTLRERALDLDEIVVTGTAGGQQRRAIGNAVERLQAAELLELEAPANVSDFLSGRAAGVHIGLQSGNLGTGSRVTVRGASSLALGNNPMVYIDGVRMDADPNAGPPGHTNISRLNDLSMDQIERIEVIKGPAAATLYGTEALNGVIQIFTKQGTPGAPTYDFRVRQGVNWFLDAEGRMPTNYSVLGDGTVLSQHLLREENAAGRPMFRNGHIQSYSGEVRGGTDFITYFLGADVDDRKGIYRNNDTQRVSVRTNLRVSASENLDIRANVGYTTNDINLMGEGFSRSYGPIPMMLFGIPASRDTPTRGFLIVPPEYAEMIERNSATERSTVSLQFQHRWRDQLTQRLTVGTDVADERVREWTPRLAEGVHPFFEQNSVGLIRLWERRALNQTADYAASYDLEPSENLTTQFSVGAQYYHRQNLQTTAVGEDLAGPTVSTVGAAARTTGGESFVENKTFGVYGQATVGWQNRMFVTAALRGDANSAFGEDFSAVYYPKLSGTWVVSEESWWDVARVNDLRLRAAWGMSGLQPAAFAAIQTWIPITGPQEAPGVSPGNPGNPELEPEKGQELELGFDASLLDDRLGLEVSYYRQVTKDAIIQTRPAPSTGFFQQRFVNLAEVSNRGLEVNVRGRPVARERLNWDLGFQVGQNKNRLEDLGGRDPITATTMSRHREGFPLGSYFSKQIAQAEWQDGQIVNVLCHGGEENNHQLVPCSQAPSLFIGPPGPVWEGGLTSTLAAGNLRLHAHVAFAFDSRRWNITSWARDDVYRNSEFAVQHHQGTLDPIHAAYIINANTTDFGRQWVERDDFVRLREISAVYTFPSSLSNRFGASRSSVGIAARNLWYWVHSEFRDLDPESNRLGNPWDSVQTLTPQLTSLVTTFSVSF